MSKYEAIIGLEIHVELATASKMFCACKNEPGAKVNTAICPICLGHPGTLPVPNKKAIELILTTGLALNCELNLQSRFDRKNYFYPDLSKGYQITQHEFPLAYNGYLELGKDKIKITRIHAEEDTAKSIHPRNKNYTLIDFNRAGAPLLELVTAPEIKSAKQARAFCQKLQLILRYLKASEANLEKGEMRCEANISLQEKGKYSYENGEIKAKGKHPLNNKVEIKNLNSFRALEGAINYEIERQEKGLLAKKEIVAETRGWDETSKKTFSQRLKETAADYRYFPEPDIPPIRIDGEWLAHIKASLPELPRQKSNRFQKEYGIKKEIADILVSSKELANFSEQVISELNAWIEAQGDSPARQYKQLAQMAANWISGELLALLKVNQEDVSDLRLTTENLAELICLVYQNKINLTTAKDILALMYREGGDPSDIIDERGLAQLDDRKELEKIVADIIRKHPDQVRQYQAGKTNLIQFFLGQVMAVSKGRAEPKLAKELLQNLLD